MKKQLIFIFAALLCAGAFAQDLPKIAVYVTGDLPSNEKGALGTRMLASLVNSGRYVGIGNSNAFLAEIEKEHVKTAERGGIDDSQISALGKQFGVTFVCIAAITPAFGEFQVSARIVDVEAAVVVYMGESASPLKSMADLASVSDQVVQNMFGGKPAPKPNPEDIAAIPEEPEPTEDTAAMPEVPEPNLELAAAKPEETKPPTSTIPKKTILKNYDRYFAWRYLPVAPPVYLKMPAYDVETGLIWKNGMFVSVDFGTAIDVNNGHERSIGGGLNIGRSFGLAHDFSFVLGGSLSFWGNNEGSNWIGPFFRLRYNIFELSYRVLFGVVVPDIDDDYYGGEPPISLGVTQQVGVGLYLEGTSGRFGQPTYDYYFAFRYLPITSPVYLGILAYDIETGWVWGDGMSFGVDLGFAFEGDDWHMGGGFNLGKSLELPYGFSLALGGSLGLWFTADGFTFGDIKDNNTDRDNINDSNADGSTPDDIKDDNADGSTLDDIKKQFLFLGPFAKLRYSIFELQYKALFGKPFDGKKLSSKIGLSHQLGIGIHVEGKKRHK